MRIVRNGFKFLWILVVFGAIAALTSLPGDSGALAAPLAWIDVILSTAAIYVTTRVFRVPEEDVVAPRARWRMTGRPTAGFVLGVLGALGVVSSIWLEVYGRLDPSPFVPVDGPGGLPLAIVSVVFDAAIAALYLYSSVRLSRRDPVQPSTID